MVIFHGYVKQPDGTYVFVWNWEQNDQNAVGSNMGFLFVNRISGVSCFVSTLGFCQPLVTNRNGGFVKQFLALSLPQPGLRMWLKGDPLKGTPAAEVLHSWLAEGPLSALYGLQHIFEKGEMNLKKWWNPGTDLGTFVETAFRTSRNYENAWDTNCWSFLSSQ